MGYSRKIVAVVGLAAALAAGCSDGETSGAPQQTGAGADTPSATTVTLTLNSQKVELGVATLKCYDFEGHLSVEALNREGAHFLMDYYNNEVALSIGLPGAEPDMFIYEPGKDGQHATVTHDGSSVTIDGTIAASGNYTEAPRPFTIKAQCAKFFATPPDSSKVG